MGIHNSISNSISGANVAGGGPSEFVLDLYPGATGAYGMRRLSTSYTGALLRVRREDTNEEADIGYDASGNLDTAALIDFCSFTNGLVSVWYDQSGEGLHMTQDAETSQPKVYDVADGVIMDGGRPAMLLDGVDDNIKVNIPDLSAPVTGFFMRSYQTIGAAYVGLGMGGPASSWFDLNSTNVFQSFFGSFSSTFPADTEQGLYTAIVDGGSSVVSYNGNEKATTLPGSLVENICVGSTFFGSFYANIKAQEFIFYPSNETGIKDGIEGNMGSYYTDVVPLLDTYGGAAAAYSLRRLSSTYTGAPVAVRNNGGLVADIGFDVFGRLDIVELKAHCGSTNGTVSTWYDQSGLGNDATQAETSRQPTIFTGGAVLVDGNGVPWIDFDGSNDGFLLDASGLDIGSLSSFAIGKMDTTTGQQMMLSLSGTSDGKRWYSPYVYLGNFNYGYQNSVTSVNATANTNTNLHTMIAGSTLGQMQAWLNSSSVGTLALATGIDSTQNGIMNFASGFYADGKMQEVIIYDSDQSGNRELIEDNIDKYYGITSEGILDKYPGAAAAYSLRRLTRAYRGPLITARRADGQLKDIYATSTGELDVVTLSAWASGQDATVQVWFDQSGEGNHAEQSDTTKQPKIYDGATGVVDEGGRPAVQFDGSNDYFQYSGSIGITGTSSRSVFTAVKPNQTATTENAYITSIGDGLDNSNLSEYMLTAELGARYDGGFELYATNSTTNQSLQTHIFNGSTVADNNAYLNGVTQTASSSGNPTSTINTVNSVTRIGTYAGALPSGKGFDGLIQEIIWYPSDQSPRRVGIEDDLAEYYNLKEYRLLDRYPGAAAAYSLRLLSTSYLSDPEPYAVRVRRSSDNEEADIGFDGFGNLNVSLLEDFCAGADGFVSRWFDQSGGGNDANQIDEGAQPQLVASGAVIVENGEPAVDFAAISHFDLVNYINPTANTTYTLSGVARPDVNDNLMVNLTDGTELMSWAYGRTAGNLTARTFDGATVSDTSGAIAINTQFLGFSIHDFTSLFTSLYINGGAATGTNAGRGDAAQSTIGDGPLSSLQFDGAWQEIVLWGSDQSENRLGIETNIDRHYKIGTLLLDKYPSAAAAYSLRLLSSSYEGPLIEVQRSGDGKTIDIYPDPFGVLDTATLSAFCNGLTGTVRTWYDQSGGGNDATQTTPLAQPKIYGDRTNLLLQSNQFDTTWTGLTKTSGFEGYDGSNDGWKITKSAQPYTFIQQSITLSGVWTLSVYAKSDTLNTITFRDQTNTGRCDFDLLNGVVGYSDSAVIAKSIQDVGNGWYRCQATFTGSSSGIAIYIGWANSAAGSVFIQDAQLETGYSATDYIETTTSAVTVSGVVTENGKPAVDFDGSNNFYAAGVSLANSLDAFFVSHKNSTARQAYYAFDATINTNYVRQEAGDPSTIYAQFTEWGGGGSSLFITSQANNQNQILVNNFSESGSQGYQINGSSIGTDTDVYTPTAPMTGLYIAVQNNGANYLIGTMQEFVLFSSVQSSSNREGIEGDINGFYEIYTPFTTGLLDDYPTAAAAYSLRALSSTYYNGATPYAIEVRRASDGATQNIGFDIEGNLDVAALRLFCSGTDGFVKTWYDQSGSNAHLQQTDTARQGIIVSSGTVLIDGDGLPYVNAIVSTYDNPIQINQPFTAFAVAQFGAAYRRLMLGNSVLWSPDLTNNRFNAGLQLTGTNAVNFANKELYGVLANGASSEMRYNGTTDATGNVGTGGINTNTAIFSQAAPSNAGPERAYEMVIFSGSQSGNFTGIESNINDHYDIYETGLLAEYPGAAAAYSVRQLRSLYNGPAIRVRRDSDDAELDIGFDENGDLDLVALGDFCKYTDGFVKVWYDQSGSGNDAHQTDPLKQPKIYDSTGGVVTENGKPATAYNGTSQYFDLSIASLNLNNLSVHTVCRSNETSANRMQFTLGTNTDLRYWHYQVINKDRAYYGASSPNITFGDADTNQHLYSFIAGSTSTVFRMFRDGVEAGSTIPLTSGEPSTSEQFLGSYGLSLVWSGTIQEFVVYSADSTNNRTGIEQNINGYFDI